MVPSETDDGEVDSIRFIPAQDSRTILCEPPSLRLQGRLLYDISLAKFRKLEGKRVSKVIFEFHFELFRNSLS